jgi:hypothetical protein
MPGKGRRPPVGVIRNGRSWLGGDPGRQAVRLINHEIPGTFPGKLVRLRTPLATPEKKNGARSRWERAPSLTFPRVRTT